MYARRYGNISLHPWNMLNGGNDDRVEVVVAETATFRGVPCNSILLGLDQEKNKLFFLGLQEPSRIDIHLFSKLFGKLLRGHEVRGMRRQNRKRKKQIRRDAADNTVFLW